MDEREYAAFRGAQVSVEVDALLVGLAILAPVAIFLMPIWALTWLFSLPTRREAPRA